MQQMEVADYVNERPKRSGATNQAERRRLCHLLFLGFGMLFIIQVIINISLHLTVYSSKEPIHSECNATDLSDRNQVKEIQKYYEGRRFGHCNRFQERINTLTGDKNMFENRNTELTNIIKRLGKEKNGNLSELSGCVSSQQCPADWMVINSRCYFLSTEKKTWEDSRKYCQSKDADLVVINSQQEQRTLYRLGGDANLLFWIGLSGTTGTTGWKWVDGSALTTQFWQSGQPDHGPTKVQDCVEMYHFNPVVASWNDETCRVERRWLCEKNPCQPS